MTRTFSNSLAAFAAVILAMTSIGTIVSVPPASAQTAQATSALVELA